MRLTSNWQPRLATFVIALMLIAACQGPPPTQFVIITSTPDGTFTPTPAVTPLVVIVTATPDQANPTVEDIATDEVTAATTEEAAAGIPTATFSQIQVAEQPFENGRMFWLEPIDQIWVIIESDNDRRNGVWMVFDDEFEEGDIEFDPEFEPSNDELMQPERGFGKLWRDNPEIREGLGWARQAEIGHVSSYQYQPNGELIDGEYVASPGYHILTSGFNNRTYRFNEINGTWQTLIRE